MLRIDARDLPIAQVLRLKIVCEDCGRRSSLDRHAVAREQVRRGVTTPEGLASYFVCLLCRERGRSARNVSIDVRYRGDGRFGEDVPMGDCRPSRRHDPLSSTGCDSPEGGKA